MALGTPTRQTSSASFNVTVPAVTGDRLAVYAVGMEYSTAPSSVSVTVGGVAMTSAGSPAVTTVGGGTENAVYTFYLLDAAMPAPGTQSVVVTITGGSGVQGVYQSYVTDTGRAQSAPGYVASSSGLVTTLPLGPLAVDNDTYGRVYTADGAGGNTSTIDSGFTERWDEGDVGGDTANTGSDVVFGASSNVTVTVTPVALARICGAFLTMLTAGTIPPPRGRALPWLQRAEGAF